MAKQVGNAYGTALFEAAREEGRLSAIREESETILSVFSEQPDFLRLLCHPEILLKEKEGLLHEVFGGTADPLITGIIELLLEKERGTDIPKVLEAFVQKALEEEKIGVASVTSPMELSEADKDRIRQKLLDTTDYETMRVTWSVDPGLIGGLVIRLGDRVVDSSLQTKLHKMKNDLLQGA